MSKRARGKALDSNTSSPQSSTVNALNAQLISPVSLLVSAGDNSITNSHHHASAPFAFTHLNSKSRDTVLEDYVLKSRGYRYCDPWNGAEDEGAGADHAPHIRAERPVAGGASKVQTRAKRAREEEGSGPAQPDLSSLTNRRASGRRTEASVASTTAESLLTVGALLHHDTLTVNSRKARKGKGSDNIKQEDLVSDASDMGDDTIDRGSVAEPSPVFGLESEGGTPAGSNRSRSASVNTSVAAAASSSLAIGKQQPIRRRGGAGQLDSSARDSVGSVAQSVVMEEAKPIPRATHIVNKAATATAAQPLPNPNILLQLQAHVRQKAMYRLQIAEAAQVVTAPSSYKEKATAISAIETLSTAMIGQPEHSRHLAQRQQRVLILVSALMGAGEETPQQTDQPTREILKDPLSVATKHLSLPSLFAKPQPVDSLMSEDEAAKFMRYAFTAGRVRREVPDPYTFLEGKAAALRTELRAAYDAQQALSAKQIATKLGDIARQCTAQTTGEEPAKPIAVVPTASLGKEKKQIRAKK